MFLRLCASSCARLESWLRRCLSGTFGGRGHGQRGEMRERADLPHVSN